MTLIVVFCGLVIHRLVVHARWLSLVGEVQEFARAIENQIEPTLKQPGVFEPATYQQLPGLCAASANCSFDTAFSNPPNFSNRSPLPAAKEVADIEVLAELTEQPYCVRFWTDSKQIVGYFSVPTDNPVCREPGFWQTRKDSRGEYYHSSYFPLRTNSGDTWGSIQIMRSIGDLDRYLLSVEIALVFLTLAAIGLIGFASWWLAGLAMRPVTHSYQQMQQFTADAAHELRTPLAALQAIVQTALRSDHLTLADSREALQILNRQSHRLTKLVQDLLMLSQMEQHGYTNSFAPCCLNETITDLIDEFEALAMAAEIKLIAEVNTAEIYVSGNAEQIYRAVANLLSNAIQYTPAKGQITIQLTADPSHAAICVKDTGIGIPAAALPHLFNRFYRVDQERSRQKGGTGLGLAITWSIVQAHRGTIRVESQLNQGSVFTISLPLLSAQSRQAIDRASQSKGHQS
jgi:signal transduction histidine kinase